MSLFARILGRSEAVGTHPDSAPRTAEQGEAHRYVRERWACPSCGRKGQKDIRGHASVLRKMPSSDVRFYDVYNVFCGCGAFSTFWADATSWIGKLADIGDKMCKPNGRCHWIMGSGQMPNMDRSLFES